LIAIRADPIIALRHSEEMSYTRPGPALCAILLCACAAPTGASLTLTTQGSNRGLALPAFFSAYPVANDRAAKASDAVSRLRDVGDTTPEPDPALLLGCGLIAVGVLFRKKLTR